MATQTLNPAQQEAVDYIDGPLLIVAGAGTGKTTVVTKKITQLIESGKAKPEEILALTFTDKAAEEMQERVDAELESGYVDLRISTFHTFCQRLLEEFGLDIGLSRNFTLLTQTDAWLLVRERIYDFGLDYYRPLGNPTSHVHSLLDHFSKCKDELISPADYLAYAEGVKLDGGDVNVDEKSRLTELANAYHRYNQLLLDEGLMDFGDLIYHAVRLLEERPEIKTRLQERFKYILVDEFQDVNWSQYVLVQQLAENSQLTVVGDDDQSIYAFRGASVSNILRFKEDFPHAKEVVLNTNYRSGQGILDVSYNSIQHNNPDRLEVKLEIDKQLKAGIADRVGKVHHLHCYTLDDEVQLTVREIQKLKEKYPDASWDDFAILVRANNHATPFINALETANLPYEFLASAGLYRQPIVLDVFNFLKLLENYQEHAAVFRLLRSPICNIKESDLQKLTIAAKKKSISYYEALKRAGEFFLSSEGVDVCNKLLNLIHAGMKQARFDKPTTVVYSFLEDSGYLRYLTREEEQGNRTVIRQIYQLKQFLDVIRRYEEVSVDATVRHFVEQYTYMINSGDEGKLYQPSDTPDSINIMTIHASKGLEYRFVFLVNMVEDRFPGRRRGRGIEIPIDLIKEQLPEGDAHIEEERRLFYVAMTRAKEQLYFVSSEDYGGTRKKKMSRFLVELGYGGEGKEGMDDKRLEIRDSKSQNNSSAEFVYEVPKAFSFSQIRSYQKCPYQYKLMHLLKIPTKGSASFSFGSTMHNTLQAFYEKVQEMNSAKQVSLFDPPATPQQAVGLHGGQASEVKVPSLEELYAMYEEKWIGDWYKSKTQREQYQKKGKDILRAFYTSQEALGWTIPVSLEGWFKIKVGDHLVHGRIDRIDQLEDGTLEIIDYKTGKSKEKLTSADKEQLLIYQIAAETLPQYKNVGQTSKLTFYYLNDNLQSSFIGKDKEVEKLQTKIIDTVDKIKEGNFAATPNKFVCQYCDYRDICEFRA